MLDLYDLITGNATIETVPNDDTGLTESDVIDLIESIE
jgi:hypothetical protein